MRKQLTTTEIILKLHTSLSPFLENTHMMPST